MAPTDPARRDDDLWQRVVACTRTALAKGTLYPIETERFFMEDAGMQFVVRLAINLRRKSEDKRRQVEQAESAGASASPFLPPEPDLTVGEVTDTHVAVLNKFNVVDHHLLVVTRVFEHQEELLTLADFEALWICLSAYPALGFYNGGEVAGASQAHKHLQIVPVPFMVDLERLPIDPLLDAVPPGADITTVPGLPFPHAFVRLDGRLGVRDGAAAGHGAYHAVLERIGIAAVDVDGRLRQSAPYNLLVTREWLLAVPRCRERYDGISVNALGFIGSLFVQDEARLDRVRRVGPMAILRSVTGAPHSGS
jgi:ATP adenylyltransferase